MEPSAGSNVSKSRCVPFGKPGSPTSVLNRKIEDGGLRRQRPLPREPAMPVPRSRARYASVPNQCGHMSLSGSLRLAYPKTEVHLAKGKSRPTKSFSLRILIPDNLPRVEPLRVDWITSFPRSSPKCFHLLDGVCDGIQIPLMALRTAALLTRDTCQAAGFDSPTNARE